MRNTDQPAPSLQDDRQINRFGEHGNAFGFLRLFFAALVILSHTPELVDGNRHRELLTEFFGTLSFGELAVDGFFVVSGYLIVGSWLKRPEIWPFLKKRIARIYPAFLAASIFCLAIVVPLSGNAAAVAHVATWAKAFAWMAMLHPPVVAAFVGSHYPYLDDAMWTIAYEFRCYLFVLALGCVSAFRRSWLILMAAIGLLVLYQIVPQHDWHGGWAATRLTDLLLGDPGQMVRLIGIYLMGCWFYLRRDSILVNRAGIAFAAAGLLGCMFVPSLAEPAVATLGAYLIFAFARGAPKIFTRINNRDDISYGVYLYAWPVEKLLIRFLPKLRLLPLCLSTFILACGLGWLSWRCLEKPVMRWLR